MRTTLPPGMATSSTSSTSPLPALPPASFYSSSLSSAATTAASLGPPPLPPSSSPSTTPAIFQSSGRTPMDNHQAPKPPFRRSPLLRSPPMPLPCSAPFNHHRSPPIFNDVASTLTAHIAAISSKHHKVHSTFSSTGDPAMLLPHLLHSQSTFTPAQSSFLLRRLHLSCATNQSPFQPCSLLPSAAIFFIS